MQFFYRFILIKSKKNISDFKKSLDRVITKDLFATKKWVSYKLLIYIDQMSKVVAKLHLVAKLN